MTESKGVEAVDRALQILDSFKGGAGDLSLAELSKATGQYKSTILRMVASLERFGYIVRGDNGRYRLGPTTWQLGSIYSQSFDLAQVIRPELKLLSDATNETASFYIREGGRRVCLFRSEPARAIRHSISEGANMPLDRGASGKVLLAFSKSDGEGDGAIRTQGFASSFGERDPEVAAIAVPIRAASGELLGALSVSGLITRFGEDRQAELRDALFRSQKRISEWSEALVLDHGGAHGEADRVHAYGREKLK
jgi:DNA-binding IclR family transcriptional regulator